jgi:hypothetical protein
MNVRTDTSALLEYHPTLGSAPYILFSVDICARRLAHHTRTSCFVPSSHSVLQLDAHDLASPGLYSDAMHPAGTFSQRATAGTDRKSGPAFVQLCA